MLVKISKKINLIFPSKKIQTSKVLKNSPTLNYVLHLEQMYTKPKKLTQSKHHLGLLAKSLWRSFVHPPTKSWLLMRLLSHHRLLIPIIRKNEAFVDWTCTVLENGEGRNSFPWKKVLQWMTIYPTPYRSLPPREYRYPDVAFLVISLLPPFWLWGKIVFAQDVLGTMSDWVLWRWSISTLYTWAQKWTSFKMKLVLCKH